MNKIENKKEKSDYTSVHTSVKYDVSDRPYSQKELQDKREKMFRINRLNPQVYAEHKKCFHFYHVKKNGRKETEINTSKNKDSGNCSVCWKLDKMPKNLKNKTISTIDSYSSVFYNIPNIL
jgi:hypothetical protein